ncbi:RdgB/HAM1 family non-canonical purine NTP pyrophosphatase [Breoghania sp.]|uniref:RdgB/HAM1 family non-canonical purine NTP pyrophosphatase n=1 Tax=Breoghania sp. TaxID=2065378 RepID=UPI002AA91009|nr:RdgB/HAM1 family non-canonical purine NTP pyrophosphatase [Breoghania sp.]
MTRRTLTPGRLVLASHNAGKLREIRALVEPFGMEVVSASELGLPEPEETGTTFEANSELKARAAAEASGFPALADDSGLSVDALGGDPGIYSARWAGPDKDFAKAMADVEEKLGEAAAKGNDDRTARFVCALCLAWPDGHVETFRGEIAGAMVWPPRGSQGFGYDPAFQPEGHARTFGEMSADEKHGWTSGDNNPLSHRARAFKLFADTCLEPTRAS